MEMLYRIPYANVLKKTQIKPGDEVTLTERGEGGRRIGGRKVKVLKVYRHHALLDFGEYQECRRIVDLEFGLANV